MGIIKKITEIYKLPILVSLTVFIALMALLVPRNPLIVAQMVLACLLAVFVLDLDYFIYAFFTDIDTDFAITLKGYLRHKDYAGAISYIYYHKDEIKEKTLQSVLFQIVLGLLTFFMVFTPINIFMKTLVIATFANSFYRLAEAYQTEKIDDWFWMLKEKPSKGGVKVYMGISLLIFFVILQFF